MVELIGGLVVFGLVAATFLCTRLARRLGRSIMTAGPGRNWFPPPPGQEQLPWELHSIQAQLPKEPTGTMTPQLINTINRLIDSTGLTPAGYLPTDATVGQLNQAINMLEQHLGLESIYHGVHSPNQEIVR